MRTLISWLVGCTSLVCGCGSGSDVEDKRSEWLAKAPATYVVGTCAYGFAPSACRLSAVDRGQVVAAESKFSPDDAWEPLAEPVEPIEALFSSAADPDDCDLSIEFDEQLSYPSELYFDCDEEGWGERVRCFVPDSLDLEVCRASTVWQP